MFDRLSGKKTYISAGVLLIWAIYAGVTNAIDGAKVTELVLLALSIMGLRAGVGKVGK